jgi:hypothetical protein
MAIVVFSRQVPCPIGPMRKLLGTCLPLYKWQIGEDDDGREATLVPWRDRTLIIGRTDATALFCEVVRREEPIATDAPFHTWHVEVPRPTTDNDAIAQRMTMLIASVVMEEESFCQLLPGGPWLSSEDMARATKALLGGESFEKVAAFGRTTSQSAVTPARPVAPARYAGLSPEQAMRTGGLDETFARILHEQGMGAIADGMGLAKPPAYAHELPRDDALPTLVLLLSQPQIFDWAMTRQGLAAIDPGGNWIVEREGPGHGTLIGRGATIAIASEPDPLPGYLVAQAVARSHGLSEEDRRQIAGHRMRVSLSVDLDTRAADYVAVRQTAKIVTLLVALAARRHDCLGLFNAGVGTVMAGPRLRQQVGVLANDEVPIQLWTWCAFHSIRPDAVSMSTGGLRPFLGYEVELWNAPGTLEQVAERMNGVLRYLLINGPVIRHGETIGDSAADQSVRCFLGESRAERPGQEHVPAMLLEFDSPGVSAPKPTPDAPVAGDIAALVPGLAKPPSAPPSPGFGRRPAGGFGRKGL